LRVVKAEVELSPVVVTEAGKKLGSVRGTEEEVELETVIIPEEEVGASPVVIVARRKLLKCTTSEKNIKVSKYQGSYRTTREHAVKAA
jgi:hypothetical protein